MFAGMRQVRAWLVIAVVIAWTTQASAQREGTPRMEVRGVVKSVDAGKRTITIAAGEGRGEAVAEKTLVLAKDVEVAIGGFTTRMAAFKEGKLADLTPGVRVGLTLTQDQKHVESITAEGPMTRGTLKAIDAAKKTITLATGFGRERQEEEKTFTLAPGIEVAVDDGRGRRFSIKEGTIADLATGATVNAWLSLNQKEITAIVAEGPSVVGTVKAIDTTTGTVTLTTRPGRGDEAAVEQVLALPKDSLVLIDDGRGRRLSVKEGKIADVPVGSMVNARLSVDGASVTMLRAEGPMLFGMLKAVDADKGSITLAFPPRNRGDDPEEKTLTVAKDARIAIEGGTSGLANLKTGEGGHVLQVRLSLDQTTVQFIMARQPGRERRE